MKRLIFTLTIIFVYGIISSLAIADSVYTITDLGTFGGNSSVANGINSFGQVVGSYSYIAEGVVINRAFLYSNGVMSDLGTLGGTHNYASSINDQGKIVGFSISLTNSITRALLYYNNGVTDLGTLGGSGSIASKINNLGQIVGNSGSNIYFGTRAFLYDNNVMIDIGTPANYESRARGINKLGIIVGEWGPTSQPRHAFLYKNNGGMTDLGTLGGNTSSARDINDSGIIVGESYTSTGLTRAFIYTEGSMSELGTLGGNSIARDINNLGIIVGESYTSIPTELHAFIYRNGVMTDLNSLLPNNSGWTLVNANSINDAGQIVGAGLINGNTHAFLMTLAPVNKPPVANAGGSYTADEGSLITFDGIASTDPDNDPLEYRWDFNGDGIWDTEFSGNSTESHTWDDDWVGNVILEVSDGKDTTTDTASVTVNNVAPSVDDVIAPIVPILKGTPITASADFTDPGTLDTHTATWNWGDGNTSAGTIVSKNVSDSHTYNAAGVYTIKLAVTDDDGGSDEAIFQYVVVYDPEGGFVTGGGWINSPAGAYTPDPSLSGKATFGFVSKYKKGATIPTGNTQFNFHVAGMNFNSTAYEWLVIANAKAQYKGSGTINGAGNYKFMLTAIDGEIAGGIDKFRIKIIDKTTDTESLVYDNQMDAPDDAEPTTAISGGSIVIHKEKAKAAPAMAMETPDKTLLLTAFPNPANPEVWIPYQLSEDTDVMIRIYSASGQLVRTLELGHKTAGIYASNSKSAYWDGTNEAGESVKSGVYFYNIQAGKFSATRKIAILK